jgi:hypothetical protein
LIGVYTFGKGDKAFTLQCLTMIDPATGWFDIVEVPNKKADYIANILEWAWLTRYPWPTEIVMDQGGEFAAEVAAALKDEYGIEKKIITARNPQANAIIERVHQVVHNMIRTSGIDNIDDLKDSWTLPGILAATRRAINSTVHTTLRATPTQLVFGRDAILNINFKADWQYIKERKQKRILQNNMRENKTRKDHTYQVNDQVLVKLDPNRKHGVDHFDGPYTVTQVNDNGTVQLRKVSDNGGAVYQTWNIRNVYPCKA